MVGHLWIHVGPPKSATTSIQSYLARAGREREFLYPIAGRDGLTAHHLLAKELGAWVPDHAIGGLSATSGAALSRLEQELVASECEHAVISSEFLVGVSPQVLVNRLTSLAPEIHFIVGARRPACHALSVWQELVLGGELSSLPDTLANQSTQPWTLSSPIIASRLRSAGGDVFYFPVLESPGADRAQAQWLAAFPDSFRAGEWLSTRANSSMAPIGSEVLRRINATGIQWTGPLDLARVDYISAQIKAAASVFERAIPDHWAASLDLFEKELADSLDRDDDWLEYETEFSVPLGTLDSYAIVSHSEFLEAQLMVSLDLGISESLKHLALLTSKDVASDVEIKLHLGPLVAGDANEPHLEADPHPLVWVGSNPAPLVVGGYSHRGAIERALPLWSERDALGVAVLAGGDPDSEAYWSELFSREALIAISWLGNQHNAALLFADPPLAIVNSATGAPTDSDARVIPVSQLRAYYKPSLMRLSSILTLPCDGTRVVLGTPPPKPAGTVLNNLESEPLLARRTQHGDVSTASIQVSPDATRVLAWQILQEEMQAVAAQAGVPWLPSPKRAAGVHGTLLAEYSAHDVTHGNEQYGLLVLEELSELLRIFIEEGGVDASL